MKMLRDLGDTHHLLKLQVADRYQNPEYWMPVKPMMPANPARTASIRAEKASSPWTTARNS